METDQLTLEAWWMDTRLLHPQHLDEIWIGQDQYRMPLASLSEYPEP